MARARFYVEVSSYWQNAPSAFIGPFASREAAQAESDKSGAVSAEHMPAADLRIAVRYWIHTTTEARAAGMVSGNLFDADNFVPSNTDELHVLLNPSDDDIRDASCQV